MSMKYIEEKSRSGVSHKKFTSEYVQNFSLGQEKIKKKKKF